MVRKSVTGGDRTGWLIAFFALFAVYNLYTIGSVPLAPDEAYYWHWSRHLDLSYFDHPPMVAYLMAAGTRLGGDAPFFVRVGGLFCVLTGLAFLFRTARRLFPEEAAVTALMVPLIAALTLLFSAGALVQTPDTPLLLFWMAALYCSVRALTENRRGWWYAWGACLGLGMLSKYTMVLMLPCTVAYVALSRNHRHWLARTDPYASGLVALALFSPVLIWNMRHGWVSFAFQLNQGFSPDDDSMIAKVLEYVGGQAGIITPLLFIAVLLYGGALAWRIWRRERDDRYLFLLLHAWPVLLFFGYTTAVGDVAEPNWPAPAYVAGLMLCWMVYHRHFRHRRAHRRLMAAAVWMALAVNLIVQIHLHHPCLPIPPNDDPTAQFHGWAELGRAVDGAIAAHPGPEEWFLIGDRGTWLAEALYHSTGRYTGLELFWPERYLFLKNKDALKERNALLLLYTHHPDALDRYRPYFDTLLPAGAYQARWRGADLEEPRVAFFVGKNFKGL